MNLSFNLNTKREPKNALSDRSRKDMEVIACKLEEKAPEAASVRISNS